MLAVSVIIVTYKSEFDICGCIDSIYENSDLKRDDLEILVVDNSPNENAGKIRSLIADRYEAGVRYFPMGENLGYGRGNNFGISVCQAKLVCVMNPDVRLRRPLFSFAKEKFSQDEKLAMLGFRQLGGRNLSFYFYPEIFFPLVGAFLLKMFNRLNLFSSRLFFPSGALVFLDKGKFSEIGGYDEKIFLYCEDSDLSKRFVNSGYSLGYESSLSYEHRVDISQRQKRSDASLSVEYESMSHYFRKHGFSKRCYYIKRLLDFKIKELVLPILGGASKADLKKGFLLFARVFYEK